MFLAELMSLKGRRALITGAAGNLGAVIADTLADLGAELLLVDLPNSDLRGLRDILQTKGQSKIGIHECDLEIEDQRIDLVERIQDDPIGLSVLVNNAALVGGSDLSGWATRFENQTTESWRRALEVNLTAVFHLSQLCTSLLATSGRGSIVNIASIYGQYGPDWRLYEDTQLGNPAAYAASKGGLIQLTRWLASTIAPEVRVNAVSPGGIFRHQDIRFVKRYEERTPLRRMATENDFRGVIAFLSTDMSSYVTGQNISVDGGWGIW
jgi:NAD(P)-dependent dehydrogenase (short-subunit alcohol dehydrogenase family)